MGMTDMHIRVHGWSVAGVEEKRPWSYTIGLLESFGHPELVVTDMELASAHALINVVGGVVRDGDGTPDPEALAALGVQLVEVLPKHLRSHWFGSWSQFYGELPRPGDFLQILPPPGMFCECHQRTYRRFDRA